MRYLITILIYILALSTSIVVFSLLAMLANELILLGYKPTSSDAYLYDVSFLEYFTLFPVTIFGFLMYKLLLYFFGKRWRLYAKMLAAGSTQVAAICILMLFSAMYHMALILRISMI